MNEVKMALRRTDDASRSAQIFEEEIKQEEILVEVQHVDAELRIPDQVEEET